MSRPRITQEMKREVARRIGARICERTAIGCAYCGDLIWIDWTDGKRIRFRDARGRCLPELDHVHSLYGGGSHASDNLVPACLSCNRSKCSASIKSVASV